MKSLHNENLLALLSQNRLETTGEYEISGFHEVDRGFASFISRLFDNARVNSQSVYVSEFEKFTEKQPADRVVVGKFDSTVEFLKMFRKYRGRSVKPELNNEGLPVINISRGTDVIFSSSAHKVDYHWKNSMEVIEAGPEMPLAVLTRSQAELTYTVTLMAFNKETIALIQSAISMSLRFARHHSFTVQTTVACTKVDLNCTLTDAQELIWSDLSAPTAENRLYASSVTFTVNTDVLYALAVTLRQERYTVAMDVYNGTEPGIRR